jgi:polyhydroxyalkanoate synthesis regulator phasin
LCIDTRLESQEVKEVFRPAIKLFFLARAAYEVGRERVEDALDSVTAKAGEYKSSGNDRMQEVSDQAKQLLGEVTQNIWQRSEVLETQTRERIRRQVADFSLGALGDTTEINELRAEIATLRAEIAELKSMRAAV